MEKRYQIFVSSTYEDLQEERQEVMHALLELDCMPAGMELFPAANEDQWSLIKKVIDDCDYYIVIIGGRYGSLDPHGIGYTEKEYRYALDANKPIIAFLHRDPESLPAKRTERSEQKRTLLSDFRNLVELKMCKYWVSPAELGSVVSRSLVRLMKSIPAVGWVRSDELPDADTAAEMLRLRRQVEQLQEELAQVATHGPEGITQFAQGENELTVGFSASVYDADTYRPIPGVDSKQSHSLRLTWDDIFSAVLAPLRVEGSEHSMQIALTDLFKTRMGPTLLERGNGPERGMNVHVERRDFDTIAVQARALGLIKPSLKKRSLRDTERYWMLTPFGETMMTRLRAIRRPLP